MYKIQYKAFGFINRQRTVEGVRELHENLAQIKTFGSVTDIERLREVVA